MSDDRRNFKPPTNVPAKDRPMWCTRCGFFGKRGKHGPSHDPGSSLGH